MNKCGQTTCTNDALYRMFWPGGEPIPVCTSCKERASQIADAMGFYLHTEPLVEIAEAQREKA